MTEEHKKKLAEGKRKASILRKACANVRNKKSSVWDKPILRYTGKEQDAFDFFPLIKGAFCRQGNYITYPSILKEITDKRQWQNVPWILRVLEKYMVLEKIEPIVVPTKKVKKERAKRPPLTEEQKDVLRERLKKAREARSKEND